jgi:hypothetical protein
MIHDRDYDINQHYFEWLCELIHADQGDKGYWILMRDLHSKKFVSFIPHDENRAFDGLELREDYYREMWYPPYETIDGADGECTVLEMLIGLARRIDFETTDPYDDDGTDKTVYWFWEMIDNLGLIKFDDESYVELGGFHYVHSIIDSFVKRKYKRNGYGGLFPLEKSHKDQRKIEIWYQMSAYLNEHQAV